MLRSKFILFKTNKKRIYFVSVFTQFYKKTNTTITVFLDMFYVYVPVMFIYTIICNCIICKELYVFFVNKYTIQYHNLFPL